MSPRCLPSSFGSIDTFLGRDVVWRISRWPLWRPSWISEQNDFGNFESLCCSDASHQVSAQSDLRFVSCLLKNFKMAARILAILNFYVAQIPPIKFLLNPTYGLGGDVVLKNCKMPPHPTPPPPPPLWWPSWILERTILAILNLHVTPQRLQPSFTSIRLMILELTAMSEMCKDDRRTDRRRTTGHGISWPGALMML